MSGSLLNARQYLANEAEKVVIYDDFSTGRMENLKEIKDEKTMYQSK